MSELTRLNAIADYMESLENFDDAKFLRGLAPSALDVRERCARVCDDLQKHPEHRGDAVIRAGMIYCAEAIRALDLGAQDQREAAAEDCHMWGRAQGQSPAIAGQHEAVLKQSASHQSPPTMTCDELADRVKRGEKWQVAESPPEQVLVKEASVVQDECSRAQADVAKLPAPARGLARLCERRCYSIAESERCSDCPSLQPQARGLSAVEEVISRWRFSHSAEQRIIIDELDRLRAEREGMVLVPESRLTLETLNAPCIYCGYNGAGYWQAGTHSKDCRWHSVGGACERNAMLAAGRKP